MLLQGWRGYRGEQLQILHPIYWLHSAVLHSCPSRYGDLRCEAETSRGWTPPTLRIISSHRVTFVSQLDPY
jgi:hypothetical protein